MTYILAYTSINDINAYQTGKPISELARELNIPEEKIIKLASNENPLGCSEQVKQYIESNLSDIARYPDGSGFQLKEAIIKHHQIDSELSFDNIILGNGSNDVLDLITRCFVSSEDTTVFSQYAFAVYWLATKSVGASPIIVPANNYSHDLPAMVNAIKPNTKVVFLANPNNPTGTYFDYQSLVDFLKGVPKQTLVVLDEAYVEYFDEKDYTSSLSLLKDYENLIITRTFSKAYGLASLRVGYALAHKDIISLLNKVRQPFNVNSFALASATIALRDSDFIKKTCELNKTEKQYLQAQFSNMNIEFIASKTNFVCVKVGDQENAGVEMFEKLLKKGIITRPLAGYGMGQWLRISIGLPEENRTLVAELQDILV